MSKFLIRALLLLLLVLLVVNRNNSPIFQKNEIKSQQSYASTYDEYHSLLLRSTNSHISKMNEGISQLKSALIYKKDERPLLLFHIGPHKTGSSAIQCSLSHFDSLLHSKESFTFLGRSYSNCQDKEKSLKIIKTNLDTRSIVDCLNNHAQKSLRQNNSIEEL